MKEAHAAPTQEQPISLDVLREKYLKSGETSAEQLYARVARALASVEAPEVRAEWEQKFLANLRAGAIGAGRIMSAAGTDIQATLINCFVQPVGDCIQGVDDAGYPGIYEALREAAETMRRGGGVGYDFSRIRPRGARVRATGSLASGPCSYINVFDQSCATVESAGARRGAQMGVLRIDHPDVLDFITAKRTPGRWNNFNVSVGVSDEFMQAVVDGADWELVHRAEPGAERIAQGATQRADGLWVYERLPARQLWDTIMQSAYDFAEPGILFLGRINEDNNLRYCEEISATNPCGEQPLPPYGCCDLGPIILTRFVRHPFGFAGEPHFDFDAFEQVVATQVRALDNVLDVTYWPLEQQRAESAAKRRIGVGFTGMGNALAMLCLRYNAPEGRTMAAQIAQRMRDAAYRASIALAQEKGAFPKFDAEGYLAPPKAISVPLKFQRQGIRYDELSDDEKDQWEALEWDEEGGEAPDEVSAEAVNQWLFNIDTVDKMLALLMERGHKVAGGDRLGKTIIFAKNQKHAEFIQERFDANYPEYRGEFARTITFKTEYAQSLIDAFGQKDRAPHIAISVDMLDTGIDVPEVVNLVFFKIVRSKAKFWQMVGRGTRLCKELYGPGQDKKDFFIFDFCQNLEFFSQELEGSEGVLAQPLSQRLFNARLELIGLLDERLAQGGVADAPHTSFALTEAAIREDTASMLHGMVAGMSLDNFVVRPQRRWVEAWAQLDAWKRPSAEQLAEVSTHLSGLPTAVRDDDEDAKRFDALLLNTQLALLRSEPALARLQTKVQQVANALLEKANIPVVREHLLLIEAVAGDEWWQDVTLPMLEQARRHLRGLIKLMEKSRRKVVYTDFADALGETTEVDLPLVTGAVDFERFRAKAKVFLRAHQDRLALHKLRRNHPLTALDLHELEALLHEAGGTDDDIKRAQALHTSLPVFIRSLVGLDREAAVAAFSSLVEAGTASASQLQFIEEIVQHLTEHGAMPAQRLYSSPFTDIHTHGPDGVFDSAKVVQLFDTLERFQPQQAVA